MARTALLSRLDASGDCDLILVAAAPGSGETALLTQWANARDSPIAGLSCDIDDAEPSWFWRDVIAAIRSAWTDVPLGEAELTDDLAERQLAIEIANELSEQSRQGSIVIDDFHLAAPEPAAMVAFINALPSTVRLILGTRHDPLFPLGRMRVQGRLLELRQADLRFTDVEIGQALTNLGVTLERSEFDHLVDLTEGWATGVHLAGLSLKATPARDAMLRRLVETDHSLVDFLMNEVIELQSQETQDFLTVTAELETFDAALCDRVIGRSASNTMLDDIRSANLFLVGLGDGWYRYHHLFGEFLRARLRRTTTTRCLDVHRAAATAFTERGDLLMAIRHSMRAGDLDAALDLLTTHMAISTSLDDQTIGGAVARDWLRHYGESELRNSPQRILACVIALNGANLTDDATLWLQRVDANEAHLDDASQFMLHATRSFHRLYQGDPGRALHDAAQAQTILDERAIDSPWAPALPMMFVQAQLWLGEADVALVTIDEHHRSAKPSTVISSVRMPGYASQAEVMRGDYLSAARLANQAHAAAEAIPLPAESFGLAEPMATFAEVALENNLLTDAEVRIEQLMRIVDNGRRPLLELKGHLLFAKLASVRGDDVVVGVHLDGARRVLPDATPPVIAHIDLVEFLDACRRRNASSAHLIVQRLPPSTQTDLLAARLRVLTGDHTGAAALLLAPRRLTTPTLGDRPWCPHSLGAGEPRR